MKDTACPWGACGPFLPGSCFPLILKHTQTSAITGSGVTHACFSLSSPALSAEMDTTDHSLPFRTLLPLIRRYHTVVFLPLALAIPFMCSLQCRLARLYVIVTWICSFCSLLGLLFSPYLTPYITIVLITSNMNI